MKTRGKNWVAVVVRLATVAGIAPMAAGCAGSIRRPTEPAAVIETVVALPAPPPAAPTPVAVGQPSAAAPMVNTEKVVGVPAERLRVVGGELAAAERQLQASAGDCVMACRALGSMERATAHLCGIASTPDEEALCQDARSRVRSGRERVKVSCGDCPGGPSLDKNAPIPSTR